MKISGPIEIFSRSTSLLVFTSGTGRVAFGSFEYDEYLVIRRISPQHIARARVIFFSLRDFLSALYHGEDSLSYLEDDELRFLTSGLLPDELDLDFTGELQ